MSLEGATCPLCSGVGEEVVWQDSLCRVVRVRDADYPGYCRVLWRAHVAEMTDMSAGDRRHLMAVVFALEAALRQLYRPDKINLASLGNMVPHVHWHVIPRFADDRHFPQAIWAAAQRAAHARRPDVATGAIHDAIVAALAEEHAGAA